MTSEKDVPRYLGQTGRLVDKRIAALQRELLTFKNASRARSKLAQLRNSASLQPGTNPAIWDITHDPGSADCTFSEPTWAEQAIYITVTTYAIHQQSKKTPMHVPGVGFGVAMRRLVGKEGDNLSLRARYDALVTTDSLSYFRMSLRSVASLLRSKDIGLDYGMLADDLVLFQQEEYRDSVRLRWARQYYQKKETTNKDENQD